MKGLFLSCPLHSVLVSGVVVVGIVVVVVLTITRRDNAMQSVVAGQAPITLEWLKNISVKRTLLVIEYQLFSRVQYNMM